MTMAVLEPQSIPAAATQRPSAEPNPQQVVLQAGLAYIVSATLGVAMKLKLFDRIGDELKSTSELALEAGVDEDYLFRVLRVLEMNGLVVRAGRRSFVLSKAGTILRTGVEGSMAECVDWITDPLHLSLYSELRTSVERGVTTFDHVYGEPFFHWLSRSENREEAAIFNNAMTGISRMCIPAFLEAYDFGQFEHIVDVGGGHGALLRSILQRNPQVRGTVAEMPAVVSATRGAIAADGLAARCGAVECDFFAAVPIGGDCYLMKNIVHDWADEPASTLLSNIRAVMPAHGKLILAEAVIDESPAPHPGKLLDIEMMAFVGGKERTEAEFTRLLAANGFALRRVIPTKSPLSLLEAIPA